MGLHCLLGLFYFPSIQLIQGVSNILCFISCLRILPSFLASIVLSLFVRKWPPNSCRLYKCTYLLQAFIKGKGGRDELEKHIFSWTPCAKRSRSVTGASGIKNFENACLRFKFFKKDAKHLTNFIIIWRNTYLQKVITKAGSFKAP